MTAIVIVVVPTPEAGTHLANRILARAVSAPRRKDAREALGKPRSNKFDEAFPPLWTWFIENPRSSIANS